MKKIYTSSNLTHCDLVRGVLEESGFPVMLKNEFVSNTAGASIAGSLGFAWPEVWVHDEDAESAVECLRDAELSFLGLE
jgi:hypothetical protein